MVDEITTTRSSKVKPTCHWEPEGGGGRIEVISYINEIVDWWVSFPCRLGLIAGRHTSLKRHHFGIRLKNQLSVSRIGSVQDIISNISTLKCQNISFLCLCFLYIMLCTKIIPNVSNQVWNFISVQSFFFWWLKGQMPMSKASNKTMILSPQK